MTRKVRQHVALPLKCKADDTMLCSGEPCKDVSSAFLFQKTHENVGYYPYNWKNKPFHK